MPRYLLPILLLIPLVFISCEQPVASSHDTAPHLINEDPYQEILEDVRTITIQNDQGEFTLTPVADYSISARVVSVRTYSGKWSASLSPVDLALVWGRLADREMDEYISYSQRNRWYYYKYQPGCPVSRRYIISHSANNHIIPANYNLSLAVKSIRENDLVTIIGYLVRVNGFSGNRKVFWGTSTTRKDEGGRSCELIYAETIRINDKVYR